MEDWIATLLVILMVPGLMLLVAVVVGAMFHLKNPPREGDSASSPVKIIDK